jgi:hypothetical protein
MALSIRGLSVTLSIILSSVVMLSIIFVIVILSVETPYNDRRYPHNGVLLLLGAPLR